MASPRNTHLTPHTPHPESAILLRFCWCEVRPRVLNIFHAPHLRSGVQVRGVLGRLAKAPKVERTEVLSRAYNPHLQRDLRFPAEILLGLLTLHSANCDSAGVRETGHSARGHIAGQHLCIPERELTRVMSGLRCFGSSPGSGRWIIFDLEPVVLMASSASCLIVNSPGFPCSREPNLSR